MSGVRVRIQRQIRRSRGWVHRMSSSPPRLVPEAKYQDQIGGQCAFVLELESGVVRVVRLTEVFRQAADSHIIMNAHRIRRGQMPDMRGADPNSDFHFVERDDPEKIAATLVKLVQERIPERFRLDPIRDVQVLCPMNRGSLGVRELNTALQRVLNPSHPGQPAVERFGWRFQIGDKVIQTENDYDKDVFNGDVGIVERIDAVEQQVTVRFDDRPGQVRLRGARRDFAGLRDHDS